MKLFLRTMMITWAVMALLAMLAIAWPSVTTPNKERTIPIHTLEACAHQEIEKHETSSNLSQRTIIPCPAGRLVAIQDQIANDLKGRALSRSEIRTVQHAEQNQLVLTTEPDNAIVGLRVDAESGHSYVYLATEPIHQPIFFFRHLGVLSPIFIAGFLSVFVAAFVVRPLTGLNAAAEAFGGGDLKMRILPPLATRRDELGDLARTFNGMAARIETLVARYKNFLAQASHELGSPLTRLNIALALAKRKAGGELEQEHDRIRQETYRLNSLVREMLLLARLESGNEVAKETVVFDVQTLIQEAHENATFEAEPLHKTVTIESFQNFSVRGYPVLLQRAIDNVLRNALRFAQKEIVIVVSRTQVGTAPFGLIAIHDDGPGISADQEDTIFEPFVTLSGKQPVDISGGSGLGLAIAKQSVLANGGRISAHRSMKGGLLIEIELPAGS